MGEKLHCPFCHNDDSRVIDSRIAEEGNAIRRRRECTKCNKRFTTIEPFSREKVIIGVRKACQGRPVSSDDLAKLAQQVEEDLRASGKSQIDSHSIGTAILGPLRELDVVAYLRFASVYSSFDDLDDFQTAIDEIRSQQNAANAETVLADQ